MRHQVGWRTQPPAGSTVSEFQRINGGRSAIKVFQNDGLALLAQRTSQVIWESKICSSRESTKDPSRHHVTTKHHNFLERRRCFSIGCSFNLHRYYHEQAKLLTILSYYLFRNDVTTTVAAFSTSPQKTLSHPNLPSHNNNVLYFFMLFFF
jgi:hypothetical protein